MSKGGKVRKKEALMYLRGLDNIGVVPKKRSKRKPKKRRSRHR